MALNKWSIKDLFQPKKSTKPKLEIVPNDEVFDEKDLVEIKDEKLLRSISGLFPSTLKYGASCAGVAVAPSVMQAVLPLGNAVSTAITASGALGIASMIVGKYYMTQINHQLKSISDGLNSISNFQDAEFRSKVFALLSSVQEISLFQSDILENKDVRLSELQRLKMLQQECMQLLGQANLVVSSHATKTNLDFQSYEKELVDISSWHSYQQTLLDILVQISDLNYALSLGCISKEQACAQVPIYSNQVEKAHEVLKNWHEENIQKLGIDLEKMQREKPDFFLKVFGFLSKDKHHYVKIADDTVSMINKQKDSSTSLDSISNNLFNRDVKLIFKDNKVFYLKEPEETSLTISDNNNEETLQGESL